MTIARYDPYAPDALDNPYPFYAWLRDEAPLYLQPDYGFAVVSRYEDVVGVARNPQDFSSAKGIGPAVADDTRNMIEMDPPDHRGYAAWCKGPSLPGPSHSGRTESARSATSSSTSSSTPGGATS